MKITQAEIDATWSERAYAVRMVAAFLEALMMGLAAIGTVAMASKGLIPPLGALVASALIAVHSLGRLGLYGLAEDLFKISSLARQRRNAAA